MIGRDQLELMVAALGVDPAPRKLYEKCMMTCYPARRGEMVHTTFPARRDDNGNVIDDYADDDDGFYASLVTSGLYALNEQCWPTDTAQHQ